MNIVVAVKFVPDLVEELEIDESGAALDMTYMRLILNEFDDHAIEQAILLKESGAGEVMVVAPELEGADDALYMAAAKGADRLIKLTGSFEEVMCNYGLSRVFANAIHTLRPELILTGVQAHNDLDGAVGPQLAEHLGMPYVGYLAGVKIEGDKAIVRKEYPGWADRRDEGDAAGGAGHSGCRRAAALRAYQQGPPGNENQRYRGAAGSRDGGHL
jgi:electron transfer flavoprotein beta subunit